MSWHRRRLSTTIDSGEAMYGAEEELSVATERKAYAVRVKKEGGKEKEVK